MKTHVLGILETIIWFSSFPREPGQTHVAITLPRGYAVPLFSPWGLCRNVRANLCPAWPHPVGAEDWGFRSAGSTGSQGTLAAASLTSLRSCVPIISGLQLLPSLYRHCSTYSKVAGKRVYLECINVLYQECFLEMQVSTFSLSCTNLLSLMAVKNI